MWTPATRRQHSREGLRYETDLTDAEWALIEPHMPKPRIRGRPREWPLREVLNAIFYVLRGGVAWRLLPNDLPPRTTVFRWFCAWRDSGLFETLNHLLVMADRERVGARSVAERRRARQPVREDDRERWAARLRCGQEGERAQAAGHSGHGWPWLDPRTPTSRRSGQRGSAVRAAPVPALVPVHRQGVCGHGLCRRRTCQRNLNS